MGGGDTAAGDEQVVYPQRQQAAIGDLVVVTLRDAADDGAGPAWAVDVYGVVAAGDSVGELRCFYRVVAGERVVATYAPAFPYADLGRALLEVGALESRDVGDEEAR